MKPTQDQKNQRLAEWAGVVKSPTPPYHLVDAEEAWPETPSYFTDLNAVQEIVLKIDREQLDLYADQLLCMIHEVDRGYFYRINWEHAVELMTATAAQRAEALGITLGLWGEGE